MSDFLTKSIENGTDADLVYLDFAKALDSVPHNRLICKLHNYGISGNLLLWHNYIIMALAVIYYTGLETFYHIKDSKFE